MIIKSPGIWVRARVMPYSSWRPMKLQHIPQRLALSTRRGSWSLTSAHTATPHASIDAAPRSRLLRTDTSSTTGMKIRDRPAWKTMFVCPLDGAVTITAESFDDSLVTVIWFCAFYTPTNILLSNIAFFWPLSGASIIMLLYHRRGLSTQLWPSPHKPSLIKDCLRLAFRWRRAHHPPILQLGYGLLIHQLPMIR